MADKITSGESEGIFNEFIGEKIKEKIEDILNDGDYIENMSDVIIEVDDIKSPTFVFDDGGDGDGGMGNRPGNKGDKLKFTFPFEKFMELIAERLDLPNLTKEGKGKIKEISQVFNTFGQVGIILNKKRTFKRAIKESVALGLYDPKEDAYEIQIRRKDKRYNVSKRVEKPKYRAVCFYLGDISFSTEGNRLLLEKKVVNFIYNWLNYNYGKNNVDHRFIAHDWDAHEVDASEFFRIDATGGTRASVAFELANDIAKQEYPVNMTNYYCFYFGDGEIFGEDGKEIKNIIKDMDVFFNRIGIVEIMPSGFSSLISALENNSFQNTKLSKLNFSNEIINTIRKLFK